MRATAAAAILPHDPVKLLKRGLTVCVEAGHPDSVEEFRFRLIAKGGAELDCGPAHPDVEDFTFRAVFTPAAMARGDALLAVTQSNPYERTGDGQYHGDDRRRGYTFRKTTPPFLLSDRLAARVRERRPISLHFYDFLDAGRPQVLRFAKETSGAIRVGRKKIAVPVVQYGNEDTILDVVAGSKFVLGISRDEDLFYMRLIRIK